MDEYAVQKLPAIMMEILKKEIVVFTVHKFKHNMSAHLDDLIKERNIAKAIDLDALEIALKDTDKRHGDLCTSLALSADAATRKEHAMQADITSILRFRKTPWKLTWPHYVRKMPTSGKSSGLNLVMMSKRRKVRKW